MKRIKTMMAGMVICTALFTACNKANYDVVPDSATSSYPQAKIGDQKNIVFTMGSLSTTSVSIKSNGASLAEFRHNQFLDLFEPLTKNGLPLPPNKYSAMEATMEIGPSDGQPALVLRGMWTPIDEAGKTGDAVPIEFAINTPHRLMAISPVMVLTEESNLLNLLNISPEKLTLGIPDEMLGRAINPDTRRILLSDQQNRDLYLIVLKNLGGMLQVQPLGNPTNPGNTSRDPVVLLPQM